MIGTGGQTHRMFIIKADKDQTLIVFDQSANEESKDRPDLTNCDDILRIKRRRTLAPEHNIYLIPTAQSIGQSTDLMKCHNSLSQWNS